MDNILKISTRDPQSLIDDIIEKIEMYESGEVGGIRTWGYDSKEDTFFHKGQQYIDHIYLRYEISEDKGLIVFEFESDGNTFAESKIFNLFEEMLNRHFKDRVEVI